MFRPGQTCEREPPSLPGRPTQVVQQLRNRSYWRRNPWALSWSQPINFFLFGSGLESSLSSRWCTTHQNFVHAHFPLTCVRASLAKSAGPCPGSGFVQLLNAWKVCFPLKFLPSVRSNRVRGRYIFSINFLSHGLPFFFVPWHSLIVV